MLEEFDEARHSFYILVSPEDYPVVREDLELILSRMAHPEMEGGKYKICLWQGDFAYAESDNAARDRPGYERLRVNFGEVLESYKHSHFNQQIGITNGTVESVRYLAAYLRDHPELRGYDTHYLPDKEWFEVASAPEFATTPSAMIVRNPELFELLQGLQQYSTGPGDTAFRCPRVKTIHAFPRAPKRKWEDQDPPRSGIYTDIFMDRIAALDGLEPVATPTYAKISPTFIKAATFIAEYTEHTRSLRRMDEEDERLGNMIARARAATDTISSVF